jgi:hypothetical protein
VAKLADTAQLSSLADETPEGRSIVVLAKNQYNLRQRDLASLNASFVPFSATTRMSAATSICCRRNTGTPSGRRGRPQRCLRWPNHQSNGAQGESKGLVQNKRYSCAVSALRQRQLFDANTLLLIGLSSS